MSYREKMLAHLAKVEAYDAKVIAQETVAEKRVAKEKARALARELNPRARERMLKFYLMQDLAKDDFYRLNANIRNYNRDMAIMYALAHLVMGTGNTSGYLP